MDHLTDTRLDALIFDALPLAADETAHMQGCALCRSRIDAYALLQQELAIARRSQPSDAQLARYSHIFGPAAGPSLSQRLGSFFDSLRLSLVLDSRQSALGLRRAAGFGHRLLYSSDEVDVELLVEPEGESWHIDGDVLPFAPETIAAPYLVELQSDTATHTPGDTDGAENTDSADSTHVHPRSSAAIFASTSRHSVQSEASGRFRLTDVSSGRYHLALTPAHGPVIEISGLEIP